MSKEYTSIHEFDFNLICEYYSSVERQGPGSPEVTIKALSFIENLSDKSQIADIGCGTGGQTCVIYREEDLDNEPNIAVLFHLSGILK